MMITTLQIGVAILSAILLFWLTSDDNDEE
jgi:hypothetical protein